MMEKKTFINITFSPSPIWRVLFGKRAKKNALVDLLLSICVLFPQTVRSIFILQEPNASFISL